MLTVSASEEYKRLVTIMAANGIPHCALWEIVARRGAVADVVPFPQSATEIKLSLQLEALEDWDTKGLARLKREYADIDANISTLVPADINNAGYFRLLTPA